MNGGGMWQHFFDKHGDEVEADRIAAAYGATRTSGQWGRAIAIYSLAQDRTVAHRCPDCGHKWPLPEQPRDQQSAGDKSREEP